MRKCINGSCAQLRTAARPVHASVRRSTRRRRHTLHPHPACARHVRSVLRRRLAVRSVHRRATPFHEMRRYTICCRACVGFDSTGIAGEQALSRRVQDAWAHFARAHSPSSARSVFPVRRESHSPRSRPSHLALARCGTPVLRPFRSSGCSRSSDRASAGLCCGGAGACEAASGCAGGRRGGRGRRATLRGDVRCVGLSCASVMGMAVINRTNRERRLARNRRRAGFQVCAPRSSTRPRAGPGSIKLGSC